MNYIGQLANQVTGKLFVSVLRNLGDGLKPEEVQWGATISGFWLDNTKFVTCAHFLESVRNTNVDETEKFLKVPNPTRPRAFVSTKNYAAKLDADGKYTTLHWREHPNHFLAPKSWPVHLLSLSRSSDIAIFQLNEIRNHPPHSVRLSELSSSFTTKNTSGKPFKETNQANMPLFAVYYPGDNMNVESSDLSPIRKEFAKQASIRDTWGLWSAESQNLHTRAEQGPAVSPLNNRFIDSH